MATVVDREVDLFGIGATLQEARRRRGLSLADVERATCIRAANLEAIEAEQFDELPGDVYGAAFVREYACFLDLDADRFVAAFKVERAHEPPPLPFETPAGLARPRHVPLAALVLLLAAAAAAVVYLRRDHSPAAVVSRAPVTRHAAAGQKPGAPQPLVLRATRADSWVVVRFGSAHGKLVRQGTLRQGAMLRFGLARPLWVGIGRPAAVAARIGPKRVRLDPGRSRYVFAARG